MPSPRLAAPARPAQVVVMRLPVEQLAPFIPQIMEGILLWCEDSKNKFRLKVGAERARRAGAGDVRGVRDCAGGGRPA